MAAPGLRVDGKRESGQQQAANEDKATPHGDVALIRPTASMARPTTNAHAMTRDTPTSVPPDETLPDPSSVAQEADGPTTPDASPEAQTETEIRAQILAERVGFEATGREGPAVFK